MKSIEFFHNVVCSYCFVQSKRLRELFKEHPDIEIKHRSFPLRYQQDKENFPFKIYGGNKNSNDIVRHWGSANRMDPDKRFNIEGMLEIDFEFPTSRLAEIAIKAAVLSEGEGIHWDIFDHFQYALFIRNLNIADDQIVRKLIKETDIDYGNWEKYYDNKQTEEEVFKDFVQAEEYGLDLIPSLIIEKDKMIKGALRPKLINEKLDEYYNN